MKIKSIFLLATLVAFSFALQAQNNNTKAAAATTTTSAKTTTNGSTKPALEVRDNKEIHWLTWEQMQEAMKKAPKKVFVDVYTDWCGWCKRMDASTFTDSNIIAYMNKNYYCIKYNAEHKEPVTLKGKEYKFVQDGRGYHELANYLLQGRFSYPTGVYLNETLDLIGPVPGYQEPKMMDKILHYFSEGFYLKMEWPVFEKEYVSPIFK